MLIGVPKEIKNHEYRVGLTPAGARELSSRGHQVLVERDAGAGIGLANEAYEAAGAQIVDGAAEVYGRADMVIKVKEPQPAECAMLRPGQVLYAYLHLAPEPELTRRLLDIATFFFLAKFTEKPLRFFGLVGSLFFAAGAVTSLVLLVNRLQGQAIANRPLLLLAVLCLALGVQLMGLGLVGEIIVHLRAPHRRAYRVRERV